MYSFNQEQIFIVTGASSGIGEGIALQLNAMGASVICIGRNPSQLEGVKEKSNRPDGMYLEQKDLVEDINRLPQYVTELRKRYGKFTGLAYCAGISKDRPLQMFDLDSSRTLFDINYFAPLAMMKGFADRRNNIGKGSSILLISSAAALVSSRGMSEYSGTKAALAASVKSIARELAPQGIRANCLLPSLIDTPMTQALDPEILKSSLPHYPMGFGKVEDVANLALFLLSDQAKWITGQNYVVDCSSF